VTKGWAALSALALVAEGALDPEAPVARLWPEFAAEGKGAVTVADALCHRAGLAAPDGVAAGDLYDAARMTAALAAAAPEDPGALVYHNMTYGHLVGEIVRRASGLAPSEAVARLAARAGAEGEAALALTPADQARCATLTQEDPGGLFRALEAAPESRFARSMRAFDPAETFNSPAWRGAAIGSGSGHATARGIARLYAEALALPPALLERVTTETGASGEDPILGVPLRMGFGLELSRPPAFDFGPGARTGGDWGAGGALGFADPERGLAFGYVTRHMAAGMGCSARGRALVAALYA
jgi:CubicO group peptidase (beta-lactamase class C family)